MNAVNRKHQGALFASERAGPIAGVVLNRPVDQVFSYRVPEALVERLHIGARVSVPLGRGNTVAVGYCVRIDADLAEDIDPARVKDLLDVLDEPPLIDAPMLDLTRWMASYYACSWGQALDAVVPSGVKKGAGTLVKTFLTVPEEIRLSRETLDLPPKQAEVLAILCKADTLLTMEDACRLASCSPSAILTLRRKSFLHTVRRRADKAPKDPSRSEIEPARAPLDLTEEQRVALDTMAPALDGDAFAAFLLHGVTGSGKTEVYLSAIERVVARGREAIVLVPEISLTPQTIRRFQRRFSKVAVLHSHMSDTERHRHWKAVAAGEVQVIVGARSAVFAPARNLGLIVIDEEHESSFKQETVPRYHARDVAMVRAQKLGIPVLLGSATPALETWRNAQVGRYTRLPLSKRVAERPMPHVGLIDLRNEKPEPGHPIGGLSAPLREAMNQALGARGQVILLLNRRGFHTFILCPKCGLVVKCDACDVALTHHRGRNRAICHTCDADREPPEACPVCRSKLHYGGVGTERLEREVKAAFPDYVVRRMDSDTMRSPGSHEQVLKSFKDGQVDILLGTQMIAKGLDFPNVTLVGVVNADTSLHLPDFRAAERTFQLVAQVAGRTGRGDRPGKVLVQTFSPTEPAIQRAKEHDYLGFVDHELQRRHERGLPPYGRIVRLIARGPDEAEVARFLEGVADQFRAKASESVSLLGPSPAPVAKIKNLFRYHLRLQAPSARPLQDALHAVLPEIHPPGAVELAVDVDPVGML